MPDFPADLVESLKDRYTLERELGRGGMATVYLAGDTRHQRRVALKVLRPELGTAIGEERFEREIAFAARLQHPHILPVFDSGHRGSWLWYVMPFIEGETLRQRLRREGRLPVDTALAITHEVADAIGYAHGQGIVHRDIKPENILLSRGHALVADFGIARPVASRREQYESLTETGMLIGTPAYMSPEQIGGERDVDGRSDLYALGCVLYEMLEGAPPFAGATPAAVAAAHLFQSVRPPGADRADVPPAVAQAVARAMEKDPALRFRDADEFLAALPRGSGVVGSSGDATRRRWRRLDPRSAAVAAGLPLALLSGGWWWLTRPAGEAWTGANVIAVTPFVDPGDSTGGGYLADGVAEDLVRILLGAPDLRVLGPGSSRPLMERGLGARDIAAAAGVGAVLEGTVEQPADSVRLTARLVSAQGDTVWTTRVERAAVELARAEEQIAREALQALRKSLEPSARVRPTESGRAHDLYLRGRFYFNRWEVEDIRKAISYFDQALSIDPTFALAYAGLADCYYQLSSRLLTPDEAMPKARAAAQRALQLDSTLAAVHVSLSNVQAYFDFDWTGGERSLRRAIRLEPTSALAHHALGILLTLVGRFDESSAELEAARALDPLSSSIATTAAWPFLFGNRPGQAVSRLEQVAAADPNVDLNGVLGEAYLLAGNTARAIPLLEADRAKGGDARYLAALARAYVATGRRGDAVAIRDELLSHATEKAYGNCYMVAMVHAALDESDRAFGSLERCLAARNENVVLLKVDPELASLRGDGRYQRLLRQLNFP